MSNNMAAKIEQLNNEDQIEEKKTQENFRFKNRILLENTYLEGCPIGDVFARLPIIKQGSFQFEILPDCFKLLIKQNSFAIQIEQDEMKGPGADTLLKAAREAEFFLFGENHGIVQIADFSHLLYKKLSSEKPRHFVTEIGPATAAIVEEKIRAGNYESYMDETNIDGKLFSALSNLLVQF